jgi:putative FmdB family regulatory protein
MPLYEYECSDHGVFEQLASMAERQAAQPCPCCERPASRVIATATAVAAMPAAARKAHALNERSRHQPRSSAQLRHGKGCSCCAPKPLIRPSVAPRRPWMIGH